MHATTAKIATVATVLTLLAAATATANASMTVLTNAVPETAQVVVVIDGRHVERLLLEGYGDITDAVHPGRNTAAVRWSGPVRRIDFKITYSTNPNNSKDVLVVRADAARDAALRSAGSRTYTFTIPR
ncbi:MAG TPA: hypothetical protein VN224_02760 [Xanthomonadales bacterium]|nr:hypothetical protein [Xanthomonadales bacterium]